TVVIQICPQSFIDFDGLVPLMRRDLLHIADMLDERFGYERETFSGNPARQNLQRDRYRVLWDIYVEGRLEREPSNTRSEKERCKRAFGRVFGVDPKNENDHVFDRVFDAESLTHRQLMDWACRAALLFDLSADSSQTTANTACGTAASETSGASAS
ncbi:MAG: hypothetical protein ACE5GE_04580, partial [Phycisphaerae bacterium]